MSDFLNSLLELVLTKETLVLSMPWLIASVFTMVIVHIIRLDHRARQKPPFFPLTLFGIIVVIGFIVGSLSQFFLHAFIEWQIPTLPHFGLLAYMGAGFFTPLGAWLIHRILIFCGDKGWVVTKQLAYELKVKHTKGVHNVGNTPEEIEIMTDTELFQLDQKKGKNDETQSD